MTRRVASIRGRSRLLVGCSVAPGMLTITRLESRKRTIVLSYRIYVTDLDRTSLRKRGVRHAHLSPALLPRVRQQLQAGTDADPVRPDLRAGLDRFRRR